MKIKDLKFREIDHHYFLLEDKKSIGRVGKNIHKRIDHPILLLGFIDHKEGLSFRVLGPISFVDNVLSLDLEYQKNEVIIYYDFFEEFTVSQVTKNIIDKIEGIQEIEDSMAKYDLPTSLKESRGDTSLDRYRDLRLIDDIQFLLITKQGTEEGLWARIEEKQDNDLLLCTVLDKPQKKFGLKVGDKIYVKYIEHPKYQGLAFVKKA